MDFLIHPFTNKFNGLAPPRCCHDGYRGLKPANPPRRPDPSTPPSTACSALISYTIRHLRGPQAGRGRRAIRRRPVHQRHGCHITKPADRTLPGTLLLGCSACGMPVSRACSDDIYKAAPPSATWSGRRTCCPPPPPYTSQLAGHCLLRQSHHAGTPNWMRDLNDNGVIEDAVLGTGPRCVHAAPLHLFGGRRQHAGRRTEVLDPSPVGFMDPNRMYPPN